MSKPIDPTVDCVAKMILGSEHHAHLLIHFINAILGLEGEARVRDVWIRNPYNLKDRLEDKEPVVDVKAVDQYGRHFQVEVQVIRVPSLPERMLYTWSSIYTKRIDEGTDYSDLNPTHSIWVLVDDLFGEVDSVHLTFRAHCLEAGLTLSPHMAIHALQLSKLPENVKILDEKTRWISLFRHGKAIDPEHPPEWAETPEMRDVMGILKRLSDNQDEYHLYLRRLDAQRTARTRERAIEREREAKLRERDAKLRERAEKERYKTENERFRRLLAIAGIDPDSERKSPPPGS